MSPEYGVTYLSGRTLALQFIVGEVPVHELVEGEGRYDLSRIAKRAGFGGGAE
jgi:hypothetical protein